MTHARPAAKAPRAARIAAATLAVTLAGCGASSPATSTRSRDGGGGTEAARIPAALEREARPIGRGAAYHSPATGPVLGTCRPGLGPRRGVHVEVFAADRVVLIPAGIGVRPPRRVVEGRIAAARCFGALVTVDPTGVLLLRRGERMTVADLFRSWGERLTADRLGPFRGRVRAYVDGARSAQDPARVILRRHAEIVLEVGPYVPPHRAYYFPPGA